jgi:hypothetical protein
MCIIVHLNTTKVEASHYPNHQFSPSIHPCKAVQKAKQINMCSVVAHGAFTASADLLVGSVGAFDRTLDVVDRSLGEIVFGIVCVYFGSAKKSSSHHSSVVAG